jgi:hypothetical protein
MAKALSLEDAQRMTEAALAESRRRNVLTAVSVVDARGDMILTCRLDGARRTTWRRVRRGQLGPVGRRGKNPRPAPAATRCGSRQRLNSGPSSSPRRGTLDARRRGYRHQSSAAPVVRATARSRRSPRPWTRRIVCHRTCTCCGSGSEC